MSNNRTGKYIHELDSLIGRLKNDASFVVSQDNLTRRVFLSELRVFINGDSSTPSNDTYYSSAKITEIINNISGSIENTNTDISNILKIIEGVQSVIVSNYDTLFTLIKQLRQETENNITNLRNDLTELTKRVSKTEKDITTIESNLTALTTKVDNMNTNLTNLTTKVDNMIKCGTAVPTTSDLTDDKQIYIQFID